MSSNRATALSIVILLMLTGCGGPKGNSGSQVATGTGGTSKTSTTKAPSEAELKARQVLIAPTDLQGWTSLDQQRLTQIGDPSDQQEANKLNECSHTEDYVKKLTLVNGSILQSPPPDKTIVASRVTIGSAQNLKSRRSAMQSTGAIECMRQMLVTQLSARDTSRKIEVSIRDMTPPDGSQDSVLRRYVITASSPSAAPETITADTVTYLDDTNEMSFQVTCEACTPSSDLETKLLILQKNRALSVYGSNT